MTATPQPVCRVCGEAVDEDHSAACNVCDARFHLNLRNDVQGKDCGDAWIDEQYLSLRYACFVCLGLATAAGEPPVGEGH